MDVFWVPVDVRLDVNKHLQKSLCSKSFPTSTGQGELLTAVPLDCPPPRERAWLLPPSFADIICIFTCRDAFCWLSIFDNERPSLSAWVSHWFELLSLGREFSDDKTEFVYSLGMNIEIAIWYGSGCRRIRYEYQGQNVFVMQKSSQLPNTLPNRQLKLNNGM